MSTIACALELSDRILAAFRLKALHPAVALAAGAFPPSGHSAGPPARGEVALSMRPFGENFAYQVEGEGGE